MSSQLISRLETLHSQSFIHRDCKPENFLVGSGKKSNMIYMIDFGLSKRYRCPKTGSHIKPKPKCSAMGTPRYMSMNAHAGKEQSRRDDLESIGFVLVFFAKEGWLPWIDAEHLGDPAKTKRK